MNYVIHSDESHIDNKFTIFLDNITNWAKEDHNVLLVVVLGSQAHESIIKDEWSDLDISIIVKDMSSFDKEGLWINSLTDYSFVVADSAGVGQSILWHIVLNSGQIIDLSIVSIDDVQNWQEESVAIKSESQGFFRSHLLILVDKKGIMQQLMNDSDMKQILADSLQAPSQNDIMQLSYEFLVSYFAFVKTHSSQ